MACGGWPWCARRLARGSGGGDAESGEESPRNDRGKRGGKGEQELKDHKELQNHMPRGCRRDVTRGTVGGGWGGGGLEGVPCQGDNQRVVKGSSRRNGQLSS